MLYYTRTTIGDVMAKSLPEWATKYFYTVAQLRPAGVLLSRSRLSRLQAAGEFPRPFTRFGDRAYFVKDEVDAWVRTRRELASEVSLELGSAAERAEAA
jgi:hypothetical protein